ncbi:MAG: AIR synthase-related protein, partial [Longimicrobiales bacterium]|nr:AIR synthase-related protein [Longimicrobiales bacterium]
PTAVTNNLNFGSPLKPAVYYQLKEAVGGMTEACELFETPVTGGNVSLYNETDGRPIYPTPVIGMVGIVEDLAHVTGHGFESEGDAILLLGENRGEMGGSEYLYRLEGEVAGEPPAVSLKAERKLQHGVLAMIQQRLLRSAHDCAEGGLACALAESALGRGAAEGATTLGVDVELDDDLPPVPLLFGESQGRVVISCTEERVDDVFRLAKQHGIPCRRIGTVTAEGTPFRIRTPGGEIRCEAPAMEEAYFDTIPRIMDRTVDRESEPLTSGHS